GAHFRSWAHSRARRCLHLTLERRQSCGSGLESCELRQAHLIERAAEGKVQALPHAPDTAAILDLAVTMSRGAVGERHRTLEGIDYRRRADLRRRARELVAAVQAAGRDHQPGALQLLEKLAHRR